MFLTAAAAAAAAQSEGTEINWKADKDLTVKLVKKTVRKGKGRPKTVTKAEPVDSFFRYFESNDIPTEDMLKDMEQDEAMEVGGKYVFGCHVCVCVCSWRWRGNQVRTAASVVRCVCTCVCPRNII